MMPGHRFSQSSRSLNKNQSSLTGPRKEFSLPDFVDFVDFVQTLIAVRPDMVQTLSKLCPTLSNFVQLCPTLSNFFPSPRPKTWFKLCPKLFSNFLSPV